MESFKMSKVMYKPNPVSSNRRSQKLSLSDSPYDQICFLTDW